MSTEAHLKQQIAARRRGLLLLTLNAQYPGYLVWSLLVATLGPVFDGSEALLKRELALLVDKKLVAQSEEKVLGQRTATWRITPAGIRIADGREEDEDILVDRAQ